MSTTTPATESAERRDSIWQEILGLLNRGPAELLPFEEVRQRLKLRPGLFRGLQHIPLDRVIGSVGRYHEFNRAFLPRRADDRWRRINSLWQRGASLPPIEVYKVGDVYFVSDGNHRVSVARANGATHIEAYVTEFHSPVSLDAETDLDDLIIKQEQAEFLERTRLPTLRPGARIELTVPGGYRQLLYLWISRHQWELRERYGAYTVDADLAAADFAAHQADRPLLRARRLARDALARIGSAVQHLVPPTTMLPVVVPARIARVNALPATWRRRIYRLTLPNALLAMHGIDPITLAGMDGQLAVLFDDQAGRQVATITVSVPECDDPLLSLGLADDPQGRLHLTHLVSYRPDAPRYNIDRTENGVPLEPGVRNQTAETAALAAGLAPGQVRAPTDVHPAVLAQVEMLAAALGHPLFLARPRFYHEAVFLERQGFSYTWGEDWMRQLDQRFRAGELAARLDGSTPFRQPAAAESIRGRSWAVYDGILEEPWPDLWMYKLVGRSAEVDTFPDGVW